MIKEGDLVYCDARKQAGIVTRLPKSEDWRSPRNVFLVLWPDGTQTIGHISTLNSTLRVINAAE